MKNERETNSFEKLEIMTLYRHHSEEFQKQIENCESFVCDESRSFNFDKKNRAELYFYSTTQRGAEDYQREDTLLYTYDVDVKLLDLTKKENRTVLGDMLNILCEKDNEVKKRTFNDLERSNVSEKDIKKIDILNKNSLFRDTVIKDIIDDLPYNGHSFFNQSIVDYENGILLKALLKNHNYDGVIIYGDSRFGLDVALINPAK